ncbi:hypothetical protein DPSP01_001827 [Paraphaeosphaeria sporulosa]
MVSKRHWNSRYKLYVLLCLVEKVGILQVRPFVTREYESDITQDDGVAVTWREGGNADPEWDARREDRSGATEWDSQLLVDLNCKSLQCIRLNECEVTLMRTVVKIRNSVIGYYHSEEGQGMETPFTCPLVFVHENFGQVQKRAERTLTLRTPIQSGLEEGCM